MSDGTGMLNIAPLKLDLVRSAGFARANLARTCYSWHVCSCWQELRDLNEEEKEQVKVWPSCVVADRDM